MKPDRFERLENQSLCEAEALVPFCFRLQYGSIAGYNLFGKMAAVTIHRVKSDVRIVSGSQKDDISVLHIFLVLRKAG
jgi:hypothetical protein